MPTIVFASSKGGAGKTTAAIVLSAELAVQGKEKNIDVTLIDVDPNQHSAKWAKKAGCPNNIHLIPNVDEDTIIDAIEDGENKSAFVLIDLEGTASVAVASAISKADLVIILCQGSHDDADEAVKTIRLINNQGRILNRGIPFAVLMTRTNPAITPRTLRHIVDEFKEAKIDLFKTSLIDREAFRAIRSFGGTLYDLPTKEVSGVKKAIENSKYFASEVLNRLKSGENPVSYEKSELKKEELMNV
jgi:chromosome partitioning protein